MDDAKRQRVIEGALIIILGVVFFFVSGGMGHAEGVGIFWRIVSVIIFGYGIYHIYAGVSAVSITVKCPDCGKSNIVKKTQKSYTCKDCGTSVDEIKAE